MRSLLTILCNTVVLVPTLFAQPDPLWMREFDVGENDIARAVIMTNDNGILLSGFTTDPSRGDSGRGWLLKLDSFGDSLWFQELPEFSRINALIPLSDDGVALCGRNEAYEAVIARTDSLGNILWNRTRSEQAEFNHLCITNDNGFVCCGYRWVDTTPRQDAWVVKFNSAGTYLWQRQTNAAGWDTAEKIIQASDGDLIITGTSVQTPNAALLISRTANGNLQWTEEFESAENTFIRGTHLIADSAAGCYMATTHEQADGSLGFRLERLSPNRLPIWTANQMESGARFELRDLIELQSGDFITCGMIEDSTRDIFLERRHNESEPLWTARFHIEHAQAYSIAATPDSGFVIVGAMLNEFNNANAFALKVGKLAGVSNLVISRIGSSNDLRLAWSAVPGAVSYRIFRSSQSPVSVETGELIGSTNLTQFDDVDALNLTSEEYYYIVTAIGSSGL